MKEKIGVNVFGYINGEFGLGEAVRLLIKAMQSVDIPVALINLDIKTNHRHEDKTFENFTKEAPYSINLVLLGPGEASLPLTYFEDSGLFKNKYNIYYLNWESEYFPQEYVDNISFFDEIWVPAKYCQNVISKVTNIPVTVIHYPIEIVIPDTIDEEAENFYDKSSFNFLFIFDYNSTLERKNPINLIKAFKKAFDKNDKSVSLTIKTSRATRFAKEKSKLLDEIDGYENIHIVEKIFEKDTLHNIIKGCDSYVSLHRSEGFGLTMAEAMFFGKPVIATGYSGNLDFMNSENSFLVDYKTCTVNSKIINYDKNTIWSNPDFEHMAELMKKVKENSDTIKAIAKKGNETILHDFSTSKIGNQIKHRVELILKNFRVDPIKNAYISLYLENRKLTNELRLVYKSKLITTILDIKLYFRNRKLKRKNKKI
ncbi:Glycosyl transferase, group 1 family protein [Flavobacterium psychrophilum]|uniref:glycosyltransferase n=1 Tax=Flavobacterium psychrophilum TaxID=96345 RepID=UPI000B7C5359|nr:glycosyltransferase [Flavobacterium psychrophilum]SNB02776.1 Glycosyl transferase, group 1 family protein [Flavobacterium psychrophilum]